MKYKVGDRVVVRQWDDMEREFGLNEYGDINCKKIFVVPMNIHCGQTMEIVSVKGKHYKMRDNDWRWTDDMIERRADMTKSDLKSGMVIETREGERYLAVEPNGVLFFMNLNGHTFFTSAIMHEDMTMPYQGLDIVKIFAPCNTFDDCKITQDILWERGKLKEMTMAEIEKALGHPVKIVKEERAC